MSLEAKIDALTAAVVNLTTMLQSTTVSVHSTQAPAAPVAAPAPAPAAPVAPPAPPAFAAPAAPAMPAPPTFAAPVAPPAATAAPFSDAKGLTDYVMAKYQHLEAKAPGSGAQIQNVLTSLGYQNINDVQPAHYAAFHQGVEALG